jgi:uncharacterized protein
MIKQWIESPFFRAAALGAGLLGFYMALVEPYWLQVTRTRVALPGLPPPLAGMRIALLTDFHAGRGTPLALMRRACRTTMALRPDMIALTGDFVADNARTFRPVLESLSTLAAPLGVYAVPGNHDYRARAGIQRWHAEVHAAPQVINLSNRTRLQSVQGVRLCIAGVDDFSRGVPTLAHLPPPAQRDFTILLAHNPDQAEYVQHAAVDLVLSGHTHGGQVRLPWFGAMKNPARHADIYEQGLYHRPWTTVYVSRGLGTVKYPIRLLARPQIAILDLAAPAPR